MRIVVAVLVLWVSAAMAQTATEPALHHRVPGPNSGNDGTVQPGGPEGKQKGTSSLPASAQGEYMLDETGSVVQITIENGILDGYISKLTDQQTSALTYFFDRTTINGNQLTFTTRQVHGIWYSFDGAIVRTDVPSKQETGFYRLKGTWVIHDEATKNGSTSTVSFKSTPRGSADF